MSGCNEWNQLNRRSFLKTSGAAISALSIGDALFANVASTFAQSMGGTGNLLVLCELAGGLDALSFLVPHTNSVYVNKRPELKIPIANLTLLPENNNFGINNQFQFFADQYLAGNVAIVQQVAYPNGNGSHFESQDIFRYGVRDLSSVAGTVAPWYERLRQTYFNEPFGALDTLAIGDPAAYGYPDSTTNKGGRAGFARLTNMLSGATDAQRSVLETYARINELGDDLRANTASFTSTGAARGEFYRAAHVASADLGTQIIKLRYNGFDTHASQADTHATLFATINSEFEQFVADLQALGMWDRTTVVFYSEFGRRNEENGSPGTDHGYGGHMILVGPHVNGGLKGQAVSTADLNQSSLPYYIDFRAVFGACIRDWLGFDPDPIFKIDGETFDEDAGGTLFT